MSYRIYGVEVSPYSVKVRSYFRYKGIDHEWIVRSQETMPEFQKYAKLPLIPLVVTPDDTGLQDSTPIIEKMEAAFPEPSIHPDDPCLGFLSALVEEFGCLPLLLCGRPDFRQSPYCLRVRPVSVEKACIQPEGLRAPALDLHAFRFSETFRARHAKKDPLFPATFIPLSYKAAPNIRNYTNMSIIYLR